ncbi:MAG: hypothetical protein JSY10_01545 [Paenibacillus sp.]|nr:hypothetical protein [Paenibacillus sp.]
MKKLIASIGAASMLLVASNSVLATPLHDSNYSSSLSSVGQLSEQDIFVELQNIDNKYEVGEVLSEEDANFIKEYAPIRLNQEKNNGIQTMAAETSLFEGYKSNSFINGGIQGFFQMSKGTINHSLRTQMTTYDRDMKIRPKITNSVTFSGYGVVGSDGLIGKIVGFTQTNSCTQTRECTMDRTTPFSGVLAYGNAAPVGQIFNSANTEANSVTISTVKPW